ncbi:HEPN domain-containing protein [Pseudohalioglobus lutimaris]|uniref:HEPN domain-containing protein n=1 Tax=Pseudohalioglobus lutimaris TaxID=1737061 RepID=UPI001054174A|nr:HEPN domain-containing protein [Pseudohalioglobus lutimaris]
MDVGKDKASGFVSNYVKDKVFDEHGVVMIDDVHGVTAYSEEYPTTCSSIFTTGLVNVRNAEFFTGKLIDLISESYALSEQLKLAMELMTSSFFESSSRARFLTLVLAAESILSPEDRSTEVHSVVDELRNVAKSANLSDQEKRSILGTLNWLYKDSISQSLRKMALVHLPNKTYQDLPSHKFIQKCYEARSKLVHSGTVDEEKHNIGTLAANLEVYLKDMLTEMAAA